MEKPLTHIVITRMWYEKEEDLLDRIKMFKLTMLPALLNQVDKNFDIGVLCQEKHRKIIEAIHPKLIPFFTTKTSGYINKCWHIFSDWKDISGLKKYDIQTNVESDDYVIPEFTQKIQEVMANKSHTTHIHFQPLLRNYKTGEIKKMRIRYGKETQSSPYSLYQPNKDNYIYIGQDSHTVFGKYADESILIPEGYSWLNIHDKNDSSTMDI